MPEEVNLSARSRSIMRKLTMIALEFATAALVPAVALATPA
jgi:hypothetical protein